MLLGIAQSIGRATLAACSVFGVFSLFFMSVFTTFITTRLRISKTIMYIKEIGVDSLAIVLLTGVFSGAVLAFQTFNALKRFGAEGNIGPIVAISLTRELGPVLTGLMVTGRAGSAIAAEIGTMQITEQIDALKTLCVNVNQYLIVPRVVASTFILPFLALFSMFFGIVGGYIVTVYALGANGHEYITQIQQFLELDDITGGLMKAAVFGLILSVVGCYKGYLTEGGAKGVGISTTQSVVVGSILILIANYFLTAFLFD